MKYSEGDIVFVDIEEIRLLAFEDSIKHRITNAIITKVHPSATRPYNIEGIDDEWMGTCDEDGIIDGWVGKTCDHDSIVYYDKQEQWVCPFCIDN